MLCPTISKVYKFIGIKCTYHIKNIVSKELKVKAEKTKTFEDHFNSF